MLHIVVALFHVSDFHLDAQCHECKSQISHQKPLKVRQRAYQGNAMASQSQSHSLERQTLIKHEHV
jgi:hypothetical protein